MRTFKHKKTGDIAKENGNYYTIISDSLALHSRLVENSDDWEEIKNEYPKVISFKSLRPIDNGLIVTYENDKCIKRSDGENPDSIINFKTALRELKNGKVIIWEVAKSENEIFTVGDRITFNGLGGSNWENKSTEILGFEYRQNLELAVKYSNGIVAVDKIQKAKEPLFVTEDGVGIYEGMKYYVVDTVEPYSPFEIKGSYRCIIDNMQIISVKGRKRFSNEKAAEEYIRLNKPMFSIKQIEEAIKKSDKQSIKGIYSFYINEIELMTNLNNLVKS